MIEIRTNRANLMDLHAQAHCPKCHCAWWTVLNTKEAFKYWIKRCSNPSCNHRWRVTESLLICSYRIGEP